MKVLNGDITILMDLMCWVVRIGFEGWPLGAFTSDGPWGPLQVLESNAMVLEHLASKIACPSQRDTT